MICPIRINCRAIISLMLLLALVVHFDNAFADETMTLIATIVIDQDSTDMTKLAPAGDFNADGYPDLAIGVKQLLPYFSELVYLYYGGPDFDNIPDLIIEGEPQNPNSLCIDPYMDWTFFGWNITPLSDFDGDGFNDIAISAQGFCTDLIDEGRIYIYFGSADPDTLPDIVIDGFEHYEWLGSDLGAGDFNGDGLSDLLAISPELIYADPRAFIYLGNSAPDNIHDWMYQFDDQYFISNSWYQSGVDLNNDGFGDFGISMQSYPDILTVAVFLGNYPLNQEPSFINDDRFVFSDDISEDNIDDILYADSEGRFHLCLGGDPLDFEPDYYIGPTRQYVGVYSLPYAGKKLVLNNWQNQRLLFYNTGVPFDTIPYNTFEYNRQLSSAKVNIGDINADGTEDLAFKIMNFELPDTVEIYSIFPTGVEDERYDPEFLMDESGLLYCSPNPFNSCTIFMVEGFRGEDVRIDIYNITGSLVRSLIAVDGKASWDATDNSGRKVSSGIYFARVETPQKSRAIKLVYLK